MGCLEYVFDRGQEKDWFGDPFDYRISLIAAIVLLVIFVFWEWNHEDPVVDLKLLRNRNFGTAIFLQFVLGMVLFGSTVLIPQFLQMLLGYTAERSGMVLSPAGFMMMVTMFIAGRDHRQDGPASAGDDGLHRHGGRPVTISRGSILT